MAGVYDMLEYLEMTRDEIAALPRESTVFVSVVSPVEVHGGHLPVGTDVYIAQGILRRTVERLDGWTVVRLPELALGAQAIPAPGFFRLKGKLLEQVLVSWGRSLAALGFRYWMVFDNHGGATHNLAEAAAEAGERMAEYHVRTGLELLDAARSGRYVPPKPYPWHISVITKLFE